MLLSPTFQQKQVPLALIAAGAFLFDIIFWHEQLALNAVLFDAFVVSVLFIVYPNAWKNETVRWLLAGNVCSLAMLIIFNSVISKIAFAGTLCMLAAFTVYAHRSVWLAAASLLQGFFYFGGRLLTQVRQRNNGVVRTRRPLGRIIRFALFPLLISGCFFIIYSLANSVFADIAGRISVAADKLISAFLEIFSFQRFLFFLFGCYITGALLLRGRTNRYETRDADARDRLQRIRKNRMDVRKSLRYDLTVMVMGKLARGPIALKNEYKNGLASLVLLNLLLLIVNCIDINFLWIHFSYTPAVDLFTMIHEGTELLIFSIVLAMLILLIFFRGNLNFYKENKWLKWGAYWWLVQNAILVFSVLLRDYYYIREFGLAYKRIGVLFFLLLVLAGLVTVFLKVQTAKTSYFLLRINAWCVLSLLVAASCVQWDVLIAKYNIAHSATAPLNLPYLLTLSDKVLPVLNDNIDVLKKREHELKVQGFLQDQLPLGVEHEIAVRRDRYLAEQETNSWLSWNLCDAAEKDYFKRRPATIAQK